MGLFDSINFEYPLPRPDNLPGEIKDLDFNSLQYQTKDFENCMDLYLVKKSGTLFREINKYDFEPGNSKGKSVVDRLPKSTLISTFFEQQLKTCTVNFYDCIQNDKNLNDYWIEYSCVFINGLLDEDSLKIVEFRITNNAARKENWNKLAARLKQESEILNKWYICYTYKPYSKLVSKTFRLLRKIIDKIYSNLCKIEKFLTPL